MATQQGDSMIDHVAFNSEGFVERAFFMGPARKIRGVCAVLGLDPNKCFPKGERRPVLNLHAGHKITRDRMEQACQYWGV
jgi:hypothetical protein